MVQFGGMEVAIAGRCSDISCCPLLGPIGSYLGGLFPGVCARPSEPELTHSWASPRGPEKFAETGGTVTTTSIESAEPAPGTAAVKLERVSV